MYIATPDIGDAIDRQLSRDQQHYSATLRLTLPDDADWVAETIEAMRAIVHDADHSQLCSQLASTVAAMAPNRQPLAQLFAVDQWFRERVHFKPDTFGTEVLRHPDQLITEVTRNGRTACDCDDASMLWASIIRHLGHRAMFRTCAKTARSPFTHVHPVAYVARNAPPAIPFDSQEAVPPGRWTPAAKQRLFWV